VLAAHPDDETLSTGGLLQRATTAGAEVRIVFATDGENNPWAQRASERRLILRASDRDRFGATRRRETLAALDRLGVAPERARFLGLPDQGLTRALTASTGTALALLGREVAEFRPTMVAGPSAADLHPDHSALAVLARLALAARSGSTRPRELASVVHNPAIRHHAAAAAVLPLTGPEQERKRSAILCHESQLHLRGPWLRSFASATEPYLPVPWPAGVPHPVVAVRPGASELVVELRTHPRFRSLGARTLHLLVETEEGPTSSLTVPLRALPGRVRARVCSTGAAVGAGTFSGTVFGGILRLPSFPAPGWRRLFLKLERRFGFFDEAGWLEVAPSPTTTIAGDG
jgi:LmbE family N-acetylglucosaminyl deacetylase